jgi:hypothetical protein
MAIPTPTPDDLERLALSHALALSDQERDAAQLLLPIMIGTIAAIAGADPASAPPAGRSVGERPSRADDPF